MSDQVNTSDSLEDLRERLKAQRTLSKSGVAAMKATRHAQQQSVNARTLRTQNVIEQLRAEEDEAERETGDGIAITPSEG